MPPKKRKARKRGSTEDVDKLEVISESTDLLSPSEVVKMRKKSAVQIQENKEKDTKTNKTKPIRAERAAKKDKTKELEKKKELTGRTKKDKNVKEIDGRKGKVLKERKRNNKRKLKNEETNPDPILYPCGICTKEVSDADDAILCEAGCEYWYHRNCTGMTDVAYELLTNEEYAEWVCDKCIATKSVPLVKIKSTQVAM